MSPLADTASWALILGVITPILTAVVNQPRWSGTTRNIVAVLISGVVGVLTCLANGTIGDGQTLLASLAAVAVAAAASYHLVLPKIAAAVERATSFGSRPETGEATRGYQR